MRARMLAFAMAGFALACGRGRPPQDSGALAADQAGLAADTAQARLWREAGRGPAVATTRAVYAETGVVRSRTAAQALERPAQAAERPFPPALDAAAVIFAFPVAEGVYSGSGRIQSVRGEVVAIDVGGGRALRMQLKVGGGPLRGQVGDTVQVYVRTTGDPMRRDEVVALRSAQDEAVYALVGGDKPVAFRLAAPALSATQVGQPSRGTMPVTVTIGDERRTLKPGETAAFPGARITVKVVASTAVVGDATYALEGDPYRLELLAWRTRPQQ